MHKKTKIFLAGILATTIGGCSLMPEERELKVEPQVTVEPTEVATTEMEAESSYQKVTQSELPDIDADSTPMTYQGSYLVRLKDSKIHILDKQGEETGRTGYESILEMPWDYLCFDEGSAYSFEYASCQSDSNIIGGLGGVDNTIYGYDAENEAVLLKEGCYEEEWGPYKEEYIMGTEYVAIPSKQYVDENTDSFEYELSEYYIWNTATNRVDGPYKGNEGTVYVNMQRGYEYYTLSSNHIMFSGMYPIKDEESGGYRIVSGSEISEQSYKRAIPVAGDCIFVETTDGKKGIIAETIENLISLPSECELATKPVEDTIMLKINNKWELWKKNEKKADQ